MAERKRHELDGHMQEDGIFHIKRILKEQNMTPYRMCKETGVNKETLKRMRAWEETRISEFDVIGDWARDNGY